MFEAFQHTLWSFGLLALAFVPLEIAFAPRPAGTRRRGYGLDLACFAGQYLLWNAPVVAWLGLLEQVLHHAPLGSLRAAFAAWPLWLQFLAAMLLSDVATYWGHRWQHASPFLWRFHRLHHTAEHVDWLAAHREHPLDTVYTRTIENLPLLVLGFSLNSVAAFVVFRGMWALFIHSHCTLSLGPLDTLLGSPRLHHAHHAIEGGGRVNFANLSPLMDVAFGTYHDPGRLPERVGIDEPYARGYLGAMLEPLLPRRSRASAGAAAQPTVGDRAPA